MHYKAGEFLELCQTRYFSDPDKFASEVIGITLSDSQQKPALMSLANGKRNVAIKSGHGTGKSCLEAIAILWFLCTRVNARVIITAPSSNQLYNTMMSEVRLWYNNSILKDLDLFRFTKDRIRINHDDFCNTWFASAVSVANPENISGTHAEHVMAVVDEGAGVDSEIFVRLEGVLTTSGSYMITCGNPSFDSGYFYDIFHNPEFSSKYDLFTFSCTDSPNVDWNWVEKMKEKYGEDSNVYKVRVLGEFAPLNEEVIIRREDVKRAIGRILINKCEDEDTVYFGVDVGSGSSDDSSVICIRKGNVELERIKIKCKLRDLQGTIVRLVSKYRCSGDKVVINIDSTGLGIQIGQDLNDIYYENDNVEVNSINFSFKAHNKDKFGNLFTEMFFNLKEIIEKISLLSIPESTIEEDLGSRRYGYDNKNRYVAERKKEFIKRFKRSPDEGDAVILAFFDMSGIGELVEKYLDEEGW